MARGHVDFHHAIVRPESGPLTFATCPNYQTQDAKEWNMKIE